MSPPRRRHDDAEAEADALALVKAIRAADRHARWQRIAAYVLIVVIGAYGFWLIDQQARDQCHDNQENRAALRRVVVQTANLGIGLVNEAPEPGRSRAIAEFTRFQNDRLAELPVIDCD